MRVGVAPAASRQHTPLPLGGPNPVWLTARLEERPRDRKREQFPQRLVSMTTAAPSPHPPGPRTPLSKLRPPIPDSQSVMSPHLHPAEPHHLALPCTLAYANNLGPSPALPSSSRGGGVRVGLGVREGEKKNEKDKGGAIPDTSPLSF